MYTRKDTNNFKYVDIPEDVFVERAVSQSPFDKYRESYNGDSMLPNMDESNEFLLYFPLNTGDCSVDIDFVKKYFTGADIKSLEDRKLIDIKRKDISSVAKITKHGDFLRSNIFKKNNEFISGIEIPEEFISKNGPKTIGELLKNEYSKM